MHISTISSIILVLVVLNEGANTTVKLRKYFIAAEDHEWDYAPTNTNVITGQTVVEGSIEASYLLNGPNRIGKKYLKSMYVGYTDATFTQKIPKEPWQGFLGPIIYGEIGDTIEILFKNDASIPYSLHTHGMLYDKDSEGAKYVDGTSGKFKADDSVAPGSLHTYTWRVGDISGPADGDDNCIAWPYHSHILTNHGTNTGVIGASIICRPGILDENGKRTDVEKDLVLLVTVIDENSSYYIDKNIQDYCTDPASVDPEDDDFVESNLMHSINGYVFGNLPGLDFCQGDQIAWHVLGLGTEDDLHTLYFHGNVLNIRGHRRDAFSITPAYFLSGVMDANNPGTWLLTSEVFTHLHAGSQALYNVSSACTPGDGYVTESSINKTRHFYIQAEEVLWNYGPTGKNELDGSSLLDPEGKAYTFFANGTDRIGGVYKKALYFQYTDDTFTTKVERTGQDRYLGSLGPVIRAEVGDEILVTFRNIASRNYSIIAHGVLYDKASEGAGYEDGTFGTDKLDDSVAPDTQYTYRWTIPEYYGPTNQDEDCLSWLYYSAVDVIKDIYAGLVGPLLVCRPGTLDTKNDRYLLLTTFHEYRSWYIEDNINMFTDLNPEEALNDGDFISSNKMKAINGFGFANLPGLEVCINEEYTWHLSSLGRSTDEHTVYFRGNTLIHNDLRTDTIMLTPGNAVTARMVPVEEGTWPIECMTGSHYVKGLTALYTSVKCPDNTQDPPTEAPGVDRVYYIGATEIDWDFAPIKWDFIRNISLLDPESSGNIFVKQEGPFIGSVYRKALYRQYTDETFEQIEQIPSSAHLGALGPIIHAEVGDRIKVYFKNLASRAYSMHPHGLVYEATNDYKDPPVQPGESYQYVWDVPAEVGPSEGDADCILYAYYSDVYRKKDTQSGLIGPIVICKKGVLASDGMRTDVDREFTLLFTVFDENDSWYLDYNIENFSPNKSAVDIEDETFQESNLMYAINGYLFDNLKNLEVYKGETVEWYLIGFGEEVDIHTVHFHGQPVVYQQWTKHHIDVVELFPGVFSTVQMKIEELGTWLLHCHVNDHMLGGMEGSYLALNAKDEPTEPPILETTTAGARSSCYYCLSILITNVIVSFFYLNEYFNSFYLQ